MAQEGTSQAESGKGTSPSKRASRIRFGGLLAAVGLVLYGAMFVGFGITDEDVTEVVGGLGIVLVGIGVFVASRTP